MNKVFTVEGYKSPLSENDLQKAIELIKDVFKDELCAQLKLVRVSAPLFLQEDSGLNDNLNGYERPVKFDIPAIGVNGEVVHSLAKWKRYALKQYGFKHGTGLITDMNAIRRDEEIDNIHSIYVDQWDWEKIINRDERTEETLKNTVKKIVRAVANTNVRLKNAFPSLDTEICEDVYFITTQELEDMYPNLTPKQRENEIARKYKTVFVMQIGDLLKSGVKHDGRAPDYDDWKLNGDIIMYNKVLDQAFEISSMGIRVDETSLLEQLEKHDNMDRIKLPYHQMILNKELPLTIGGGIGQSRLCMLLIGTCHIGEVQASLWDKETLDTCKEKGINLL